jgi:hypothetical protein
MLDEKTSSSVIDVVPWMHRGALDVIGTGQWLPSFQNFKTSHENRSAAFDYAFDSLVNEENQVAQSYHNLL